MASTSGPTSGATSGATRLSTGTAPGAATGTHGSGDERTLGQLVVDATRDVSALIRSEIALAKAELKQEGKQAGLGAAFFIGAALFGFLALVMLCITLAYVLVALGLPTWAGFLIVAVLLLGAAGLLALIGRSRLKKVGPPERTIATTKDTVQALKGHH